MSRYWAKLIANKDRESARLELAYTTTLERAGVNIVKSRAVLEDAHTVRLLAIGERIRARLQLAPEPFGAAGGKLRVQLWPAVLVAE